jgi:Flp pilus assembly protein TadD
LSLFLWEPTPFYAGRLIADPLEPSVLLGLAVLAAGGWLMAWGWRHERAVFFGLAWFFLTLLPVANLVPIPGARDAAIAERYLYIPSIGVALAIGAAGARLAARAARRGLASWALGALLLAALGLYLPITLRWVSIWEHNERLYRQMVRRAPEAAFPHISLAGELLMRGQSEEPKALIARAVTLEPALPEVHLVDGAARRAFGDLDGALAAARRAYALAPTRVPVLIELGTTHAERRELAEALQAFRQALHLEPHAVEAYNRMGVALFGAGDFEQARQAFQRACDLSPDFILARANLAATLLRLGRIPEAVRHLETGLRLAPGDPRLRSLLAEILARAPKPIPGTGTK